MSSNIFKRVLVTGGAGFIGSAFVRMILQETNGHVLTFDKLTYAGNLANLGDFARHPRHTFVKADITDLVVVRETLESFQPSAIIHLAAETHVDRSIDGPDDFIATNVLGTHTLLGCCLKYWEAMPDKERARFRFLHVSTDEVFGSLEPDDAAFTEISPYRPNSPYSASKAAADHLVRSWCKTYGLPVVTTYSSNNYGPFQFPEKLIPLMTLNAVAGKTLPIYGCGDQIRDWLYVDDHARALITVLERGRIGDVYCISGGCEKKNLDVVREICSLVDELAPHSTHRPHENLINFVADRLGHDQRYAMHSGKMKLEFGWAPQISFERGLRQTVKWYLEHSEWRRHVQKNLATS